MNTQQNALLDLFSENVHTLTLVRDPDGLLLDEQLLAVLTQRNFLLINKSDIYQFRQEIEHARLNHDHYIIVVTQGPLKQLPYDLWEQGHQISLELHNFFPKLAYPIVQTLTPNQRWYLSQSRAPNHILGQQSSIDFILWHVFQADIQMLNQPAQLVTWLNRYHQQPELSPMPEVFVQRLVSQLQSHAHFRSWPLKELINNAQAFSQFINEEWQQFLQSSTGKTLGEPSPRSQYQLSFAADDMLQDTLPQLLRSGVLQRQKLAWSHTLPDWAQTAVVAANENADATRADELFDLLAEQFGKKEDSRRWAQWQTVTRVWAELTNIRYKPQTPLSAEQRTTYQTWQSQLDASFYDWLTSYYAPLANKRLPQPHHLYHVPEYIAHQRREGERVALLVMDGMSLGDWLFIREYWLAQQPGWLFEEHLLLALVPSVTAVSRQALVSGLRPADFTDSLTHNRHESTHWKNFWTRKGLPVSACGYGRLSFNSDTFLPAQATSSRVHMLCLINNDIDEMLHGASLGAADVQASLGVWLEHRFSDFFESVHTLLKRGFSVYITSDHGHVEAQGIGQPSEGLAVETRSKRARIYRDENTAVAVQRNYPDTILWHDKGLLPDDVWVLLAKRRVAFAQQNEVVVTHGGLTLDEMVVPFVQIKQKS